MRDKRKNVPLIPTPRLFLHPPQTLSNIFIGGISSVLPVGDFILKNLSLAGNNFSGSVGPNKAKV